MLHVGTTSRFNGVEVTIDDTVQVLGDNLRRLVKFVVVEGLRLLVDVLGKGDRRQVTHRRFILVGILQDLGTVTRDNTIKHTAMFEWLIETERVRGITEVFDRDDLHIIVNTSIRQQVFNNFHIFLEVLSFDGFILTDDPEFMIGGTANRETFTCIDCE